jgi:hypothetical protein
MVRLKKVDTDLRCRSSVSRRDFSDFSRKHFVSMQYFRKLCIDKTSQLIRFTYVASKIKFTFWQQSSMCFQKLKNRVTVGHKLRTRFGNATRFFSFHRSEYIIDPVC